MAVGVCGNQPEATEAFLRELGVPLDLVGSSERWGVEKPDPAFYARIAAELALPPAAIAHVGDRVDNDVVPARAAGLIAVHLRRGPWGVLQAPLAGGGAGPSRARRAGRAARRAGRDRPTVSRR